MQKVYVEWWDACSDTKNDWTPVKEATGVLSLCYSLGWIVKETPESITVAGHTDDKYEDFCGEIVIPTVCIKKIEYL